MFAYTSRFWFGDNIFLNKKELCKFDKRIFKELKELLSKDVLETNELEVEKERLKCQMFFTEVELNRAMVQRLQNQRRPTGVD
jgi:hypothetical protein